MIFALGASVTAFAQCAASFTWNQPQNNVIVFSNTSTPIIQNQTYFWWDFGDNSGPDFSQNPVHTYNAPGSYSVSLSMFDSLSLCMQTYLDTITVTGTVNCNMAITSLTISDETCANCADGSILAFVTGGTPPYSYVWSNSATTPFISGLTAGTYYVCITDANGCNACDTAQVNVLAPSNCSAAFTTVMNSPGNYSFTSTLTSSPTANYFWDFGDGNYDWTSTPTHSYVNSGNYVVCLTVFDSASLCMDMVCDTLMNVTGTGGPSSCNATFFVVYDTLQSSFMAWVINLSSGSPSMMQIWNWGDNTSDTAAFPTHVYSQTGTYTICLYVIDTANNCNDTMCQTINVVRLTQQAASVPFVVNVVPSIPTGISEAETEQFSVWPVPSADVLNIRSSQMLTGRGFRIIDLAGRTVEADALSSSQLNIQSLEKGIYLLQIMNESGNYSTQRFVKQ